MTIEYPPTRKGEDVDELAGVRSLDPYRWLEDAKADDVRQWQGEQAKLASETVRSWPGFDALRELVEGHTAQRFGSAPTFAGGRWFRSVTAEGDPQAGVVAADEPYGDGDTVYSPEPDGEGTAPFLSWFAPSPDGRILAVGLCDDGSEQNGIHLFDLHTRAWLDNPPRQRLMDAWSGGVHWLPDSSGFFFTALQGDPNDASYQVWFHRLIDATTTRQEVPWLAAASEYRMVLPDASGTRAVAIERLLTPCPVAIADLDAAGNATWRPFVADTDATVAGRLVGDRFIAVTDLDADRGRLVAIDVDRPDPADWATLVPESEAVLRTLTVVGELLYVSEFVDTYARVQIYDRSGTHLGEVPLPGRGAIGEHGYPYPNLVPRGHPGEFWFPFSTLTSSWGTYRHRPGATEVEELQAPAVIVADAVVEDHWATSRDGTQVPYHLVRRRDVDPTAPQPSLLYAYGGYNAPWVPQYPGGQAALVAAGGVFVHTHLRGGSEFGHSWWLGGRKQTKQNCYDDLYAVAEDLLDKGRTSPGQLGVTGGSNGGLMAGVAITQRPDLWAAVVPRAPLIDLVGACREPYGRYAVAVELADIDDPADVRRMLTFSPYQLVEKQTYPAVYLDAGDTDPRCSPWHARKFAAALQDTQQGEAPILLHVWENVGHGWATAADVALEQAAEWLAFVCRQLGIEPPH
ncbi:prolyl oligopeptidase family serine peptidase [Pseudonocardia parietis]|uniref:prolyl oligopeptidase n=1 Tax=Pseudonocardia parietis TaxID=570936 RepID=A0ABS4VUB1_9PSEU|nr:prolyl oligopeptidase family serine peptidase [Pseudonocardia parietis]MBP2367528.1 prolyl oligopeptidase [Pseudonocardia parietis]